MSDEALEKLKELQEDVKEIKEFISKRDVVLNKEYVKLKGIGYQTLMEWFKIKVDPCPREDARHVSIKDVDAWKRRRATRKSE